MMYDVFFTIRGPGGESEVPNNSNPVEAKDMKDLLLCLVGNVLPGEGAGLETTGIRIAKTQT